MGPKDITVLRPCIVKRVGKALFHRWEEYSQPIEAGLTIGSHPAGVVSYVKGIVEDENGQIYKVPPVYIRFVDHKIEDYYFDTEELERMLKEV